MNPVQIFGYVILPQAVTSSVPGMLENLIFLLKETSVFSTISLMDLMFIAKDLIGIADRILFLENGEIVEESSDPKAFFSIPATARAKAFLKSFDYE